MERTEPTTEFLGDTPEPVRDHLAAAQDLPTFLAGAGLDTPTGEASVTVPTADQPAVVRAEGFADGKLVAARTVSI